MLKSRESEHCKWSKAFDSAKIKAAKHGEVPDDYWLR